MEKAIQEQLSKSMDIDSDEGEVSAIRAPAVESKEWVESQQMPTSS